jgi:hypothetical protein
LWFLVLTIVLLPTVIKIVSDLSARQNEFPEGLFPDALANTVIDFCLSYTSLPAWIIIFIGMELSNGHANRVVFAKGRRYYFVCKLVYCMLISFFFSVLGLASFAFAIETSAYQLDVVDAGHYTHFFFQIMTSMFSYSVLILFLTFIIRSPGITFVVYFSWEFAEGIISVLLKHVAPEYRRFLPFHIVGSFYSTSPLGFDIEGYCKPLLENPIVLILPSVFVCALMVSACYIFKYCDMKPLSD